MKKTITREIDISELENDRIDWSKPIRTMGDKISVELISVFKYKDIYKAIVSLKDKEGISRVLNYSDRGIYATQEGLPLDLENYDLKETNIMKKTITREIDITSLENDLIDWSKPLRTIKEKIPAKLLSITDKGEYKAVVVLKENEDDLLYSYTKCGKIYKDSSSQFDLENYEPKEKSSIELLDDLMEKLNNLKRILSN